MLLAGACGSRTEGGTDATTTTSASTGGGTTPGAADPTDGKFGTIESPCGKGTASGATDIGVTNEEIRVVTVADPGSAAQAGLNQGVFDTADAFQKWCNDQGGINGRKLVLEKRDAQLLYYPDQVAYTCEKALALVGGIAALDADGAVKQVECALPNVPAAAVSPRQTLAPYTFQPLPNPVNTYLVGPALWIKNTFPGVADKAAALNSNLSVTNLQVARQVDAYTAVGFNFIYKQALALAETNFLPTVLDMKNRGVEYMTFSSTYEKVIPLQKEMMAQGWKPEVQEMETNFYNAKYPAQGGAAVEGTYVRLTAWPVEEADKNPAMAEYLAALKAAVPNAEPELLGIQGWSASLMAAQALKNLGSNVTRTGFVSELQKINAWTGGGLHGTSDPGQNKPAPCFIMMQIKDGKFVRAYPLQDKDQAAWSSGNGFACSPDNVIPLPQYNAESKAS